MSPRLPQAAAGSLSASARVTELGRLKSPLHASSLFLLAAGAIMATMKNHFYTQACNNAWANHRILKACGELRDDELFAPRTGFFPSIMHTLNHTLTVDWFYISALEGDCVGYAVFESDLPVRSMAKLTEEQQSADQRLIKVCAELSASELAAPVALVRDTWTQTERADRVLLHLFQHQVHHRGQVHTMLSGTSVPPPQLDEFFLEHEAESVRKQRADELASIGLDDEAIWTPEL